jgi:biopolymer transport protein ExbD
VNFHDEQDESPTVPMAPLIDIVFIMLIFFITTSAMETFEKDISIDLPKADVVAANVPVVQVVFVEVANSGAIKLEGNDVDNAQLKAKLSALLALSKGSSKDLDVVIRADASVKWQRVVDVIEAATQAGVTKLSYSITDRAGTGVK